MTIGLFDFCAHANFTQTVRENWYVKLFLLCVFKMECEFIWKWTYLSVTLKKMTNFRWEKCFFFKSQMHLFSFQNLDKKLLPIQAKT